MYHQGPVQGQGYKPGPSPAGQGMSVMSNNLSELDQLLSDLNSAQFLAEVDKKTPSSGTHWFIYLDFKLGKYNTEKLEGRNMSSICATTPENTSVGY